MAKYFCGCARCTVSAVTGPVMLITLGALFAIDQAGSYSFQQTWPVLLIVYGAARAAAYAAPSHSNS